MKNTKNQKRIKIVEKISKSISKKGKIKGKNKKESKYLKKACVHHYYNRKGKLKPAFFNTNDGYCVCESCGRRFPTKPETKSNVKDVVEDILGLANQAVTATVAGGLGEKAVDKLVLFKVMLEEFPKDYDKIMKAISKEENLRRKKRKGNNGGGSNQYGSWSRSK